jgi:cytidylate kinase
MECRVVTISRTLGSGAEEIGHTVAEKLGFRYIDNQIINWAAERAGVSPATIEKSEHSPPLVDRILQYLGAAAVETGHAAYVAPAGDQPVKYERLIERVIREAAAAGNLVIVAHGASVPLAGLPGLLRVFITASPDVRAERLAKSAGVKESEATKLLDKSDRERREFLQRFYEVKEELPTRYDLVINTDNLSAEAAANLIVVAAGALE